MKASEKLENIRQAVKVSFEYYGDLSGFAYVCDSCAILARLSGYKMVDIHTIKRYFTCEGCGTKASIRIWKP